MSVSVPLYSAIQATRSLYTPPDPDENDLLSISTVSINKNDLTLFEIRAEVLMNPVEIDLRHHIEMKIPLLNRVQNQWPFGSDSFFLLKYTCHYQNMTKVQQYKTEHG